MKTAALAAMLALAAAPALAANCHPDGKSTEDTVVFNSSGGTYGEAIQKVFFTPFEQECGVKVVHVNSQRNYAQMRMMVRSGNMPWDLGATVADQEFPLGIKDGLFQKLPDDYWDKLKDKMLPGSFSPYGAWATPYSQVLVYSTASFPKGMQGWDDFWNLKDFPGSRSIANNPIMLVVALLADGVPPEKMYPLDLDRAFRKLDALRPAIRTFYTTTDTGVQGVGNGEFVAATTLSGRAAAAMRANKPVGVSWDRPVLHTSWTFILKGNAHPRAAEALLYFMQRADRQAELARLTGYTGGNKDALALLTPDVVALLPATPEHLATASIVDAAWWAENQPRVAARWDAWVAQR